MSVPSRKPGRIKIIALPEGKSPQEIKEAWVGVEMPCWFLRENGDYPGYIVTDVEAIAALAKSSPAAADWYRQQGYPKQSLELLSFKPAGVQVLEPVMSEAEFLRKNN